jgi:hypothetical protein
MLVEILHQYLINNLEHRLPETHSSTCATQKKKFTQLNAKKDTLLLKAIIERNPKAGSSRNTKALIEQERIDMKKRLRNKIKNSRKYSTFLIFDPGTILGFLSFFSIAGPCFCASWNSDGSDTLHIH